MDDDATYFLMDDRNQISPEEYEEFLLTLTPEQDRNLAEALDKLNADFFGDKKALLSIHHIRTFARDYGYDTALQCGEWDGFEVYRPVYADKWGIVDAPLQFILVKHCRMRMSTPDEAKKIDQGLEL